MSSPRPSYGFGSGPVSRADLEYYKQRVGLPFPSPLDGFRCINLKQRLEIILRADGNGNEGDNDLESYHEAATELRQQATTKGRRKEELQAQIARLEEKIL